VNREDQTEQCARCRLEVPWGTCDDEGLCFECKLRMDEAKCN
jgi:hypothetical protein